MPIVYRSVKGSKLTSTEVDGNFEFLSETKQDELNFDTDPTEDSGNPVTSGGVFAALVLKQDVLTIDSAPLNGSTNPVESNGVFDSLALKQSLVNSATALTDAATIDLSAIKHTLSSSSATRTFTISYTGDDIAMAVTLSATGAVYTFPATALCVSEGVASGDNTCTLAGVSGDKYIIAIKKIGTAYYVACKNFGQ